ncbi:MAG: cytochrome c maturation protein CcmE, partial [Ramlibacter sp.]
MKAWKKRAAVVVGGLAAVSVAAALALNALNSNIALYVTPSEVAAGKSP